MDSDEQLEQDEIFAQLLQIEEDYSYSDYYAREGLEEESPKNSPPSILVDF